MRKIGSITFVVSCLLILSLTSCGNLVTQNTGAIVITLPGAAGARWTNGVPDDGDLANAEYTIRIYSSADPSNDTYKGNKQAGETLVVDNIPEGSYTVVVVAHVAKGYAEGYDRAVTVTKGTTASVELTMHFYNQFAYNSSGDQLRFRIARQPDDYSEGYDCYLIGDEGISIHPNLDRSDINSDLWEGVWPFKITSGSEFWLGGTYYYDWHTKDDGKENNEGNARTVKIYADSQWVGKGTLDLPDLSEYNTTDPNITIGNSGKIWWEIDQDVIDSISLQGEVWCKIGILDGSGNWITGTHFTCCEEDSNEYKKLSSSGVKLEDLTLYEGMTAEEARRILAERGSWYVQCSLFYKPYGADSTWQIELPTRQSITTNYYD